MDSKKYTRYWKALEDENGATFGVIGIQVDIASYEKLIPLSVIEEPYSVSFIGLYDVNFNPIWGWGCSENESKYIKELCDKEYNKYQDHDKA